MYGRTETTYEHITGIKGSFAHFMRGIDLLLDRGLPLKLKTIVMKWNHHEFEDIKTFADSKGVDFRYDPFLVGGMDGGQTPFSQRLSPEEVVALERPNKQMLEEMRLMFGPLRKHEI